MGDHRARIMLEMQMHGKTFCGEMWINWSPEEDTGCDRRVTEWFESRAKEAMADYWEEIRMADEERDGPQTEEKERAELARLKAKYESSSTTPGETLTIKEIDTRGRKA